MTLVAAAFLAHGLAVFDAWWREAKMWTLMYRGGLLAGAAALVAFVLGRIAAARRERVRLEALVASRTRQLRQSEELFRSIFEHASEGIFQSSLDGRNLRANPAMARLCGYDSPEQMERELTDIDAQFYIRPGRRQEINALLACDGAALGCESEIRRRDGSTLWVSESVQSVVEPASGQTVYQGSMVDITARREMEAAREKARLAAEAANAARSAFLTHITHELRTPLTGILSNARVALRDGSLDETNRARYRLIASSGEHLLALIDEVLDLSRIEAGHMPLAPGVFSLDELLRTVADAFRARAAEKRLDLRCTLDPFLSGAVRGDPRRLRQVLDNLLGNALKFTAQGSVVLTARRTRPENVGFEVADTGIGIQAEELAGIFEPFRQVATTRPPDQAGVGLGLHISARLVGLMGGELRVESSPGRGSRFYFDLPLPDVDAPAAARASADGESAPPTDPADRALPPPAEIQALLKLSLEGDVVGLRARLKELAAGDAALAPFTREVEALAAGFRMDAIGELLTHLGRQAGGTDQPG